jgi:serine/threonine protein kinase
LEQTFRSESEVMTYCPNPVCPSPQNLVSANFCQACGSALLLAGRYRLQSLLGQGGFGRTFLAANSTGDRCVVKHIYNNSLAGEAGFEAEADRLRRLGKHPQIPSLIEAVENELGQFLVQQFVSGDNLQVQIERDGPWTQSQVRSLLTQLIPVLQYVHSFDIIHRDIKPANIILEILESHQPESLPILVDFGAAKWVRQTPAKTVIGSAGYAAPEQSMGQATFASDIYGLGLTCLHLLTSIHPFALYSAAEDRWVWRDYLPQPIETRLAQVLDQMVARSLQQRYSSMDQVALDLQFSQDPLIYAPKQLLTRAKESVEPFINARNALQKSIKRSASRPVIAANSAASQRWQCRYRITQPIGITKAIALTATTLATAGNDGAVRLWHLPNGQLIHTFQRRRVIGEGHAAAVTALTFHPDGRALYSASNDGTIKEWDSAERVLLNTLTTAGWTPTALMVTSDGRQLISPNSDGKIVLWDIATLMPIFQLAQHQQRVNAIALSYPNAHPDDLLASASDDGTVKLWQRVQQEVRSRPKSDAAQGPQLSKSININQKTGRRSLFDRQESNERAIAVALHTPLPQRSAPSATQQQLIVATTAGLVQLYNLDAQLNVSAAQKFYQSPQPITALALSYDGYLAIGTEDSVLTLWQISTGECVAKLAHDWGIGAIAFSTDGQTLISASADEIISVWQRES